MTGHIDPTKEVFAQFRENDREGPIHMLNLVRLKPRAAYPDGREATGAEAYAAYGRELAAGVLAARRQGGLAGRVRTDADRPAERALGPRASSPSIRAFRLSSR